LDKIVTLEPIGWQDKLVLRNLFGLYLHDFSEFLPQIQISRHGLFECAIDEFWSGLRKKPFFVMVDGMLAGFVVVNAGAEGDDPDGYSSIAEFFILRGYRRQGIGKRAAHLAFSLFPGAWRVHEMAENVAAQAFWRRTIQEYTAGQYTEGWSSEFNRVEQRFSSAR
jgi:predicted acetyltransferase